jgi:hypothetical protein
VCGKHSSPGGKNLSVNSPLTGLGASPGCAVAVEDPTKSSPAAPKNAASQTKLLSLENLFFVITLPFFYAYA